MKKEFWPGSRIPIVCFGRFKPVSSLTCGVVHRHRFDFANNYSASVVKIVEPHIVALFADIYGEAIWEVGVLDADNRLTHSTELRGPIGHCTPRQVEEILELIERLPPAIPLTEPVHARRN